MQLGAYHVSQWCQDFSLVTPNQNHSAKGLLALCPLAGWNACASSRRKQLHKKQRYKLHYSLNRVLPAICSSYLALEEACDGRPCKEKPGCAFTNLNIKKMKSHFVVFDGGSEVCSVTDTMCPSTWKGRSPPSEQRDAAADGQIDVSPSPEKICSWSSSTARSSWQGRTSRLCCQLLGKSSKKSNPSNISKASNKMVGLRLVFRWVCLHRSCLKKAIYVETQNLRASREK